MLSVDVSVLAAFSPIWIHLIGRTLVQLKVGDGLPLVHGDEPPVVAAVPPAAEVDYQLALVAVERGED